MRRIRAFDPRHHQLDDGESNPGLTRSVISLSNTISNILIAYLTATNVSILLAATGIRITHEQKKIFLNPVRDLGDEQNALRS